MLLEIQGLSVVIEGLPILHEVSLSLEQGEIVSVVGANGAGKTTLLRTIIGLIQPIRGHIRFGGAEITHLPPSHVVRQGIVLVLEGRQLFPNMSVKENLLMGAWTYRKDRKRVKENLDRIYELFPILQREQNRLGKTFSGGEQQMISLGRGLMSEPKVLMLDEPSLGLAPKIIDTFLETVKRLNENKMNILLVEQNVDRALDLANRGYVLESGRIALSGTGKELLTNEHVRKVYLGL
ncbi:MAG: ABC transporter ATP-binding protein [Deltaproteobacteria bacterium]|nr:ABC transporter ATP-binding protein [Deltaproteobacteria bacterium]